MSFVREGLKAGARRLKESGSDSIQLVVDYVKQETVDPIKALGRFLAYGTVGAFSMGLGILFLLVAILRALQTETAVFHGNWSWVPYLLVFFIAILVLAFTAWLITLGPARPRKRPEPKKEQS